MSYKSEINSKGFTLIRKPCKDFILIRKPCEGFTLIELLIVIAILAILSTMFLISYPASQKRARDAVRKSAMQQYQTALEKYANRNNGNYINSGSAVNITTQCSVLGLGATCPDDPVPTTPYRYFGSVTQYVLWARLEGPTTTTYSVVCSNGRVGEVTTAPTTTTCPL